LVAMHSSSYSDCLLEEGEEDLLDSSELEPEQQHSMPGSPMQLGGGQQQQLPRPSRLGIMTATCSGMQLSSEQQQQQACDGGAAGKASSSDLASVVSEGTTCNLVTAMSLGRPGAEGDLLFDLDDESGSSAANTPVGSEARCARGVSPLGRRLPAAAGSDMAVAAAGAGAAAAGSAAVDEDVVMAAAGSLREADGLSSFLSSVQLQPAAQASAFTGLAAAGSSGNGSAAVAGPPSSDSGSLCSPLSHALSTPVGGVVDVARSMQVGGNGWMFRDFSKAKAGLATVGRCINPKKSSVAARRRTGINRTMYPPPVIRAPPKATNEVLSGLSQQQWQDFMQELLAYMDDALRPGKGAWRGASQAAGLGAAAMSCPRF